MALPYFYEPQVTGAHKTFSLSQETAKHSIQVLRMQAGEKLQLTDGKGGLFTCIISHAGKKNAEVEIISANYQPAPPRKISLAVSLLKNASRFEWLLEKATELGVTEIIPLLCQRTERQHFRHERMSSIVVSAMLQSQQAWLPHLYEPLKFEAVVQQSVYLQKLVAHCEENGTKHALSQLRFTQNVQMLIGPEGDFSPAEIEMALKQQYAPVSLGNTRLRTETAAITAVALLVNL